MALPRFPSDRNRLKSIICSIRSWLLCFLSGCIVGHLHGRYWDKNNNDSVLLLSSLSSLSSSSSSSLTSSSSSFPALTLTDNTNTNNNNATTDGWRQIDVFYGEPAVSNLTWFSQAAQDELIVGLLRGKRNGYFIDLAANDALVLSNTYALERDYGWYVFFLNSRESARTHTHTSLELTFPTGPACALNRIQSIGNS